jgi:hypothetical protein
MDDILAFCQLEPSPQVRTAFEREFDTQQTRHRRAAARTEDVELIQKWIAPTVAWLNHS